MREFSSNEDIYAFVTELSRLADDLDDADRAERLEVARRSGGVMPTEQLWEIRNALSSIGTLGQDYPDGMNNRIDKAISAIDRTLRRANRPY